MASSTVHAHRRVATGGLRADAEYQFMPTIALVDDGRNCAATPGLIVI
jgi:hypothetical protein